MKKSKRYSKKKAARISKNHNVISEIKSESSHNQVLPLKTGKPTRESLLPVKKASTLPAIIQESIEAPQKLKNESVTENPTKQIDLSKTRFTLGEILSLDADSIPFLLQTLIPEQAITILAGQSDVGKGMFYLQLALSIIQGKEELHGFKLNSKYKKVLLVSSEDGPIQISNRVQKQLGEFQGIKELDDRMIILTTSYNTAEKVEEELEKDKYDLVILDALGDLMEGDSNHLGDTRRFLNQFTELIHKYSCTFLIIHHIGKGKEKQGASKNQLLGSVGIEGKARSVLMLEQPALHSSIRHLSIVKGNYVSEEDKKNIIFLDFDPNTLTYSKTDMIYQVGKDIPKQTKQGRKRDPELVAKALKLRNDGYTLEEIASVVKKDKSTVSRWFKKFGNDPSSE